jgi:FlaG/FlaF family flagellin (archaellin)
MWIMERHYNNKAVSQVIAALLLIAISVAAAVLVYVFSIGLLGSLQSSGGQQTKQQVIMEAYNWPASGTSMGTLTMTLRNTGPAAVQFADWFISGQAATALGGSCTPFDTNPLDVGASCELQLTTTLTLSAGVAYVIKGVSVDGAVFSYSAIYGQAS